MACLCLGQKGTAAFAEAPSRLWLLSHWLIGLQRRLGKIRRSFPSCWAERQKKRWKKSMSSEERMCAHHISINKGSRAVWADRMKSWCSWGETGIAPPSSWHLLWSYPLDFSVPGLVMSHSSPSRLWFGFITLESMSGCFNDVTILHCDTMWSPDTAHNQSVWMSHVYISASLARDPEPARCVKGVLQRVL